MLGHWWLVTACSAVRRNISYPVEAQLPRSSCVDVQGVEISSQRCSSGITNEAGKLVGVVFTLQIQ